MKTWQFLWGMIGYRPGLYVVDSVLWILFYLSLLAPGLVLREFFDTLSGHARLGIGIWGIVALQVAAVLATVAVVWLGGLTDSRFRFVMRSLLQRNMLESILNRPGARALSESVGQAISRFRDDAGQGENAADWTIDVIGQALFAITAFALLLSINVQITLLVFIPLAGVLAAAQLGNTRLERYRKASRKATARVTGALGPGSGSTGAGTRGHRACGPRRPGGDRAR